MEHTHTRAAGVALALVALAALTWCSDSMRPRPGDETGARVDADAPVVLRPPSDEVATALHTDATPARHTDATPAPVDAGPAAPDGAGLGLTLESWEIADGTVRRGDAWRTYQSSFRPLKRDDLEGARRLLAEAVAADASFEQAYAALGVVHMRAKAYDECVEVSRQCVARAFAADVLGACAYNLGVCLEHQGDHGAAAQALELSLEARANATAEKALSRVRRRLGRDGRFTPAREIREAAVRSASESFLRSLPACRGPVAEDSERPGVVTCGLLAAWGTAGAFSARDAEEVLLAISGDLGPDGTGAGYGVLLRRDAERWAELARAPRLGPGEGGVDFEGSIPLPDGRGRPVVQVSDCREGCCQGAVVVVGFEPREGGVQGLEVTIDELLRVGANRGAEAASHALVTAARPIALGGSVGLLLRHETREGRANPFVRYLRVRLDGARPRLVGEVPPDVAPRCG